MAKATKTTRAKKKQWLKIHAGKPFNQQLIGETAIAEPGLAVGKPMTVNLMNLTGEIRKQNTNIKFVIDKVIEGKATTKVTGYEMISAGLKRMVRRRSSKIDMSFTAVTADKFKVRIKPFILTRNKVSNSVLNAMRRQTMDAVRKTISNTGFQNIIQDITNHRFQIGLKKQLSKVYPIKTFEIKSLKVITERKQVEKEVKPVKEVKKLEPETKKLEPEKEPASEKEAIKEKAAPEKEPTETKKELKEKAAPEKEPTE